VTLPLDPAVDGDVVNLDAAFGEQLFDVAVPQAEAQVPTDGQDDHVGGKLNPAKADRGTEAERGRQVLMLAASLLERGHSECNSAEDYRSQARFEILAKRRNRLEADSGNGSHRSGIP
jgi:hypothetical protein